MTAEGSEASAEDSVREDVSISREQESKPASASTESVFDHAGFTAKRDENASSRSTVDDGDDCFKDLPSLVPIHDVNTERKDDRETASSEVEKIQNAFGETKDCEIVSKTNNRLTDADSLVEELEAKTETMRVEKSQALAAETTSEAAVIDSTNVPTCPLDRSQKHPVIVATTELDLAMRLNALDRHLVEYLALDRLRQLMVPPKSPEEEEDETFKRRVRRNLEERRLVSYPTDRDPIALFSVCEFDDPLSSTYDDDVFPMFSNTFTVGTNDDCDVVLSDYVDPRSPCYSRFSTRHLVVFYDKYAGVFELLNYGADGVVVDNVYYGCDVDANRNRKDTWNGGASTRGNATVQEVEVKEGRGRGRKRKETRMKKETDDISSALASIKKGGKKKEAVVSKAEEAEKPIDRLCECGRSLPTAGQVTNGWEGSAVLYHGSVIQIGCFTLVFSAFES